MTPALLNAALGQYAVSFFLQACAADAIAGVMLERSRGRPAMILHFPSGAKLGVSHAA